MNITYNKHCIIIGSMGLLSSAVHTTEVNGIDVETLHRMNTFVKYKS
jgi:hypothetical protein